MRPPARKYSPTDIKQSLFVIHRIQQLFQYSIPLKILNHESEQVVHIKSEGFIHFVGFKKMHRQYSPPAFSALCSSSPTKRGKNADNAAVPSARMPREALKQSQCQRPFPGQ
jgi:hypothetical protein